MCNGGKGNLPLQAVGSLTKPLCAALAFKKLYYKWEKNKPTNSTNFIEFYIGNNNLLNKNPYDTGLINWPYSNFNGSSFYDLLINNKNSIIRPYLNSPFPKLKIFFPELLDDGPTFGEEFGFTEYFSNNPITLLQNDSPFYHPVSFNQMEKLNFFTDHWTENLIVDLPINDKYSITYSGDAPYVSNQNSYILNAFDAPGADSPITPDTTHRLADLVNLVTGTPAKCDINETVINRPVKSFSKLIQRNIDQPVSYLNKGALFQYTYHSLLNNISDDNQSVEEFFPTISKSIQNFSIYKFLQDFINLSFANSKTEPTSNLKNISLRNALFSEDDNIINIYRVTGNSNSNMDNSFSDNNFKENLTYENKYYALYNGLTAGICQIYSGGLENSSNKTSGWLANAIQAQGADASITTTPDHIFENKNSFFKEDDLKNSPTIVIWPLPNTSQGDIKQILIEPIFGSVLSGNWEMIDFEQKIKETTKYNSLYGFVAVGPDLEFGYDGGVFTNLENKKYGVGTYTSSVTNSILLSMSSMEDNIPGVNYKKLNRYQPNSIILDPPIEVNNYTLTTSQPLQGKNNLVNWILKSKNKKINFID